jgi:ligand-binding SRPBCC domain-containing protein
LLTFRQSFIVKSPKKVWHFYTDAKHLEIITSKEIEFKIISTTHQNIVQGQEIWVSGKIFEMLSGPFKKWRHLHMFHNIDDKQRDNR